MRMMILCAAVLLPLCSGVAEAQTLTAALRLRAELQVRNPERPAEAIGALPLVEERIRTTIEGQHATSELVQVFHNRTGARLEGQYVLRPSMDARVEGFAYYIGEERIVGEVLERQTARAVYREVTTVRRDPAILEQTADGEFTFRVFPIEPNEQKRVETTVAEWLSRRGSQVTYRMPASSRAQAEVMLRDLRARNIRSSSHAIDLERVPGGVRIRTRGARESANGELVLRWEVQDEPWQPTAFVHRDEGQDGYFLVSLAAPEGYEDRISEKDVTLVLDRSGSMAGNAIANARQAAVDIIRRLGPNDRVNVIAFDDDVDPLYGRPRAASPDTRNDAINYVSGLRSGGGTDIAYALTRAFASQHDRGGRPRVVIFLTDGQSEAGAALEAASREQRDVRVFTVGIGSGVNRALLSRLAAEKRGTFTYIDRAGQIESEVGHLYAQIARPLLVDVSIEVEGAVATRVYPRTVPDLFIDDELVIAGRFRGRADQLSFTVRGRLADRPLAMQTSVTPERSGRHPWVGRRWAISRVDHLLEQIQLEGTNAELQAEVTSLALAYHFVTPYTAFLAIPEREVTAAARATLDRGRQERRDAMNRHLDATTLSAGGEATAVTTGSHSVDTLASGGTELDYEMAGGDSTGGGGERGGEWEQSDASPDAEPMMAAQDEGGWGGAGISNAGCASCAVTSAQPPPRSLALLGLLLGLFFWRRRR